MRTHVHAWGGLAGQLSALATALWIERTVNRSVGIIFHRGGVTHRNWTIGELCAGIPVRQVDEPALSYESGRPSRAALLTLRAQGRFRRLVRSSLVSLGFAYSEGELSRAALAAIGPQIRHLYGYATDWSIALDSAEDISRRVSETYLPNFLEDAGSVPEVSIHWRLGDYLVSTEVSQFHGIVSPVDLSVCVERLPRDLPVRLFSDSPELADELLKTRARWLWERARIVERGDVWSDLFAMSRSRYFVGTNSGISAWAALAVRRSTAGIALLPSTWLAGTQDGASPPDFCEHYSVRLQTSARIN